ncbi:MAG: hypothetical protein ACK41G_10395 [Candidatus Thermochlorobacter sp.]
MLGVKLFPREHVTFQTALSKEETLKRLVRIAQQNKSNAEKDALHCYYGKVESEKFSLEHKLDARSFFFTRVSGKVDAQTTGTLIQLTVGLRWFGNLFLILFSLLFVPALIGELSDYLSTGTSKNLLMLALLCTIFYGWLVIEFNSRSKAFKEAFQKALDAQIVEYS